MDRGESWQATVHAKRRTRLSDLVSMQGRMHVEPRALSLWIAPPSLSSQTSSESWIHENCVAVGV